MSLGLIETSTQMCNLDQHTWITRVRSSAEDLLRVLIDVLGQLTYKFLHVNEHLRRGLVWALHVCSTHTDGQVAHTCQRLVHAQEPKVPCKVPKHQVSKRHGEWRGRGFLDSVVMTETEGKRPEPKFVCSLTPSQ